MIEQQLYYLNKNFKILNTEKEFIIHPAAFGLLPVSADALQRSFASSFLIKDYRLILDNLKLYNEGIEDNGTEKIDLNVLQYNFQNQLISYSGTILIGDAPIKEYNFKGVKMTSFSYKDVYELVFEDGNLKTTIDHSKEMARIRKNLDLKLRCLTKKRDVRCITHFINSSFIGNYKPFSSFKKRFKYLGEMKKDYKDKTVPFSIKN